MDRLEACGDGVLRPPDEVAPGAVPREPERHRCKAMATRPEDRYPTVAAKPADVQAYLEERFVMSCHRPAGRKWAERNKRVVRPVAFTTALALATFGRAVSWTSTGSLRRVMRRLLRLHARPRRSERQHRGPERACCIGVFRCPVWSGRRRVEPASRPASPDDGAGYRHTQGRRRHGDPRTGRDPAAGRRHPRADHWMSPSIPRLGRSPG